MYSTSASSLYHGHSAKRFLEHKQAANLAMAMRGPEEKLLAATRQIDCLHFFFSTGNSGKSVANASCFLFYACASSIVLTLKRDTHNRLACRPHYAVAHYPRRSDHGIQRPSWRKTTAGLNLWQAWPQSAADLARCLEHARPSLLLVRQLQAGQEDGAIPLVTAIAAITDAIIDTHGKNILGTVCIMPLAVEPSIGTGTCAWFVRAVLAVAVVVVHLVVADHTRTV